MLPWQFRDAWTNADGGAQAGANTLGFDILLTPHSSQLASLFFARPGSSVIEIQGCRSKREASFLITSQQMGLHHQVLRAGNEDDASPGEVLEPDPAARSWHLWNHTVDIAELRQALRRAVQSLQDQGTLTRT